MTSVLSDILSLDPAEADSALSPGDEDVLAGLFENWERFSEAGAMLRPISPLALSLLSLDQDSSTPGRDLTKIIESDPILTARMLGLANSVAFAGSAKPIFKVSEAIVRLGVDTVLTAAFSQLTAQWLRGACKFPDPSLIHGLWLEYLITAHCAREIAKRLPDGEVDGSLAYAAGLLHDVGTIALLCAQPEPMSRFLRSGYGFGGPLYAGFVTAHTHLGAALLHRWRTPADIATVAARHHSKSVLSESAALITVFLADHLHLAVLDHDRAGFENPEACSPGCFGNATERITAALAALGVADELDVMVGRVAAESRGIEMLATAIHP
ncbi:MAG: HDOD domain-containing protein [Betaproteobacteria bacterium]|nr:HDOD domain-containing protein [Betaproteobacteria bacterium]